MKTNKNIPGDKGYKVPQGYFKEFSEHLQERIELEKLLGQVRNTGFEVPLLYFENKKVAIIAETINKPLKNKKGVFSLSRIFYSSLSVAAAILLLLVLKPFSTSALDISDIDTLVLQDYLEQDNLEGLQYDMEDLLITENSDFLFDAISASDTNIVDYLQQETDITTLDLD